MMMTKEEFVEQFSKNLANLIHKEGISVAELAKEARVSRYTIQKYLSNSETVIPSAYTIYKLSVIFGCEADELLL